MEWMTELRGHTNPGVYLTLEEGDRVCKEGNTVCTVAVRDREMLGRTRRNLS